MKTNNADFNFSYNATSELMEYLRIVGDMRIDGKLSSYTKEEPGHELGYILLKIMESVPHMKNLPDKEIDINIFLKKINQLYSVDNEGKTLYDDFLSTLYLSDYTRWCNGFNFVEIRNIYNYIVLCMEHREYYKLDCLLKVATATTLRLISPDTSISGKSIESISLFKELNANTLQEIFNREDEYIRFNSYKCSNLSDICIASLGELISNRLFIKRCEHCNRWFIEYTKNDKYCNGESPKYSGMSCRQAARKEKVSAVQSSFITKTLTHLRQMCDNESRKEDKKNLNSMNNEWKLRHKNGEVTEEEYVIWIISNFKTLKKREELFAEWQRLKSAVTHTE